MGITKNDYISAAERIKETFRNNHELILRMKKERLNSQEEDISRAFKDEFGYEALESLSNQEKLKKLVWVNGGTDSLFYEITLGRYKYQGSVVMGNGPYSYLARYNQENETYSIGNQFYKNKTSTEAEVLTEINNFIDGLKDADVLINLLNEDSSIEDYQAVYDTVLEKINNNSIIIILNKYFSLLYQQKWTKFIGKDYGVKAVKALLDIEVDRFATVQYHLMKIQYILTQQEEMTPYEFMLTYDELMSKSDKANKEIDLSKFHEDGFIEWINQIKISKNKSINSWIAADAKVHWLRGNTDDEHFKEKIDLMPVKNLLLKIESLDEEEITRLKELPSNLFSLTEKEFLDAHELINDMGKKYKEELRMIRKNTNLLGNQDANYSTFKRTKFATEYLDYLREAYRPRMKTNSKYAQKLLSSKNIIFRGAPGTGKTHLARQIATEIISNNRTTNFEELTNEEKERFEFVQFHPSYDYTDFVEGYRPINTEGNQMGFELMPGLFKQFLNHAIDSQHIGGVDNFDEAWTRFFEKVNEVHRENPEATYDIKTLTGKDMHLQGYVRSDIEGVWEKDSQGNYYNKEQCYKVYQGKAGVPKRGLDNYRKAIVKHLKEEYGLLDYIPKKDAEEGSPHVFVIDEINRGEISKIFGELFFAIDPGYRGKGGAVKTQYSTIQAEEEQLYIPENVYIVGTMNDIDRSVENFDFAMRRRFRFIEIKADDEDQLKMLESLKPYDEAVEHLKNLNREISNVEGLNDHYHIGPSYFLKLEELDHDFDLLWQDYLEPLLEEYIRGFFDEKEVLKRLRQAYDDEIRGIQVDGNEDN